MGITVWPDTKIVALGLLLVVFASQKARSANFAITMDDFNVHETSLMSPAQRNDKILTALARHQASGALFVAGRFVRNAADQSLLRAWSKAGHMIGNHSFDHRRFAEGVTVADEIDDIKRGEAVVRNEPGFAKLFRFPMLAEGETAEQRNGVRTWLDLHGYRSGAVTIDASDWYIDQRLRDKLSADPGFDLNRFRDYYLDHMWSRAQYYDGLALQVLGHSVGHTLLVHFNLLNALFLDDLLTMFESRGWKIIGAREAFQDPVYAQRPLILPAGQSLLWALAREAGVRGLRYPGENDTYEKPKMDALGL